ncbi:hypothetical protein, partial [Streptomyces sp. F-3]|uniref:hypothetical protein n=1 Tax=Streptomyces sp. F-3 TaxID=1840095 RepID=UPI00135F1488
MTRCFSFFFGRHRPQLGAQFVKGAQGPSGEQVLRRGGQPPYGRVGRGQRTVGPVADRIQVALLDPAHLERGQDVDEAAEHSVLLGGQ